MYDKNNIDDFIFSALDGQEIKAPVELKQQLQKKVFWLKFINFSFVSKQNIATVCAALIMLGSGLWFTLSPSENIELENQYLPPVQKDLADSQPLPQDNIKNIDAQNDNKPLEAQENKEISATTSSEDTKADVVLADQPIANGMAVTDPVEKNIKNPSDDIADSGKDQENGTAIAVTSAASETPAIANTAAKTRNMQAAPTVTNKNKPSLVKNNDIAANKNIRNWELGRLKPISGFIPEKPHYENVDAEYQFPVPYFADSKQNRKSRHDKMRNKLNKRKKTYEFGAQDAKLPPGLLAQDQESKYFEAGLGFMPQKWFNTVDGNDQIAYNTDVYVRYSFAGNYFVQSGLGITTNTAQADWEVSMHEYIGSYNDLDSMTFVIDPVSQEVTPIYHTSNEDVNDTAVLTINEATNTTYTYFSLPILAGYRFNSSSSRFGFLLKTGFIMAMQLEKNVSDYTSSDQRDIILKRNNIAPGRYRTQWQYSFGVAANYRLSGRFRFELEPELRYFLRSAYENALPGQDENPYAVGVRMGLLIKL